MVGGLAMIALHSEWRELAPTAEGGELCLGGGSGAEGEMDAGEEVARGCQQVGETVLPVVVALPAVYRRTTAIQGTAAECCQTRVWYQGWLGWASGG